MDYSNAASLKQAHMQQMAGQAKDYNEIGAQRNGLVAIADRITEAVDRIEGLVTQFDALALGIHGPRPEPGSAQGGISAPNADSLSSRVSYLMTSVDRLQRAYDSIVR